MCAESIFLLLRWGTSASPSASGMSGLKSGSFLLAAVAVFARWRRARLLAMGAGAIVLGWLAIQVAVIGYVPWMQPTPAMVAVVILGSPRSFSIRVPHSHRSRERHDDARPSSASVGTNTDRVGVYGAAAPFSPGVGQRDPSPADLAGRGGLREQLPQLPLGSTAAVRGGIVVAALVVLISSIHAVAGEGQKGIGRTRPQSTGSAPPARVVR